MSSVIYGKSTWQAGTAVLEGGERLRLDDRRRVAFGLQACLHGHRSSVKRDRRLRPASHVFVSGEERACSNFGKLGKLMGRRPPPATGFSRARPEGGVPDSRYRRANRWAHLLRL